MDIHEQIAIRTADQIAEILLQINAIKLKPANPFTWASGWRSPIYCDNRKVLSHPWARKQVADALTRLIAHKYPDVQVIAGVATGAIAHGVLVAETLVKPFIYVRSAPKAHGLTNQVEGEAEPGSRVVVVEDLISTGGSSLAAVEALRAAGYNVLGMVAIFSYGFPVAEENFARAGVALDTLSNYTALINYAIKHGYVGSSQLDTLSQWRKDPANWNK